jgi:divalent metal cation (Fe/Co/Zn/Cd) transporter
MVSGLFLGYEMKHLITGESISQEKLKLIENIINKNENISKITDLKILPIGSKQYLALVKLDYKDSLGDTDIVEINTALKNEIVETESTITEIYFNPQ